ncbi:MAG: hypothetical protein AW09_003848 [Candidatus Accumulibacter phosphatis]|uniref:Uncharacterized protein n=1 Tax=Candidatus Accumulibacter phosphatis TaxID=327160 RepID=A0A080LRV6_9PROT|nr:MAG: hypothetical protein AW09_003848 [Candidatus Accumulibacter phosphatis]
MSGHQAQQLLFLIGLAEIVIDSQLDGVLTVFVCRSRGDHDDRDHAQAVVGTHVAGELETIHARHFDVDQQDVRDQSKQLFERIDAVLGGHHLVAFTCQQTTGDLAHGQRIVHDHDRRHGGGDAVRGHRLTNGWHRRDRAHRAIAAGQGNRVQDQHHLAIPENGRAIDADHPCQLGSDVLDDDFLIAQQFVDLHRDSLAAAA